MHYCAIDKSHTGRNDGGRQSDTTLKPGHVSAQMKVIILPRSFKVSSHKKQKGPEKGLKRKASVVPNKYYSAGSYW